MQLCILPDTPSLALGTLRKRGTDFIVVEKARLADKISSRINVVLLFINCEADLQRDVLWHI